MPVVRLAAVVLEQNRSEKFPGIGSVTELLHDRSDVLGMIPNTTTKERADSCRTRVDSF